MAHNPASARFAKRSRMSDTDVYKYATSQAPKYGQVVQMAGKQAGGPQLSKDLLSSLSRRTTESSRKRAIKKLLGTYGIGLRP